MDACAPRRECLVPSSSPISSPSHPPCLPLTFTQHLAKPRKTALTAPSREHSAPWSPRCCGRAWGQRAWSRPVPCVGTEALETKCRDSGHGGVAAARYVPSREARGLLTTAPGLLPAWPGEGGHRRLRVRDLALGLSCLRKHFTFCPDPLFRLLQQTDSQAGGPSGGVRSWQLASP